MSDQISVVLLLAASLCVIVAVRVPQLQDFLNYGKIKSESNSILDIRVPKMWFVHFYLELQMLTLAKCIFMRRVTVRDALLLVQAFRRIYEQYKVFPESEADMHVTHYIVGLVFYAIQALHVEHKRESTCLTLVIFAIGSFWQHACHLVLADTEKYKFPAFPYTNTPALSTACPHYGAELLIYLSLVILEPTAVPLASVIWVAISLGVSGMRTKKYYKTPRWAILPGVY